MEEDKIEIKESSSDAEYVPDLELRENNRNKYTYSNLALTAVKYYVSCRASAAFVNTALKDMEILNKSNMLDRKKV